MTDAKRKMILGVDLEATLANIMPVYCRLAKEQFGHVYTKADVNSWNFWYEKIGKDAMWRLFREVWQYWEEIEPEEDRIGFDVYLANKSGYEIAIITATQKENLPNVYKWLSKYNIPYNSLVALFNGQRKIDYPWNVLVDDNPEIAKDAALVPERKVFLYDQPWNRQVDEGHVKRVKSFGEVLSALQLA